MIRKCTEKRPGQKGFTLLELVVSFALIIVLVGGMFLAIKLIYRSANDAPTLTAAEHAYEAIKQAAGDQPFDQAVKAVVGTYVLVGEKRIDLSDYMVLISEARLEQERYREETIVIEMQTLVVVYITASGASLDPPARN